MTHILVTGGAGFIGSHLCERLLDLGYKVTTVDNFTDYYDPAIKRSNIKPAQAHPHYTLMEGDIRDKAFMNTVFRSDPISIVVHLAALAGVRKSLSDPLEYIDVDIKGTVNLLEASRQQKVDKFIFASSSSVYGNSPTPFTENNISGQQLSPYAVSKLSGEYFCRMYSTLFGLSVECLRFFTVYGPRQRPEMAIHHFTRLIDEGREIPIFGNGKSSRDYTYIDDLIDGIIRAINFDCKFEIFNLGNSKRLQLNHLIDILENQLGKPAIKRYMHRQKGDAEHTFADISKARRLLGYDPKVNIHQGIGKFAGWYLSQKI